MAKSVFEVNSELVDLARRTGDTFLTKALREAMKDCAEWWRTKRLPLHFSERAGSMWPWAYQPRSRRYCRRKRRLWGHTRPMEYSGALRRTVTGTPPRWREPKSAKSLVVEMLLTARGRAMNLWTGRRRKGKANHDFKKAIRAVSSQEVQTLLQHAERRMQPLARRYLEQGRRRPARRRHEG